MNAAIAANGAGLWAQVHAAGPDGFQSAPTQADVQAIADKLDELINTLNA